MTSELNLHPFFLFMIIFICNIKLFTNVPQISQQWEKNIDFMYIDITRWNLKLTDFSNVHSPKWYVRFCNVYLFVLRVDEFFSIVFIAIILYGFIVYMCVYAFLRISNCNSIKHAFHIKLKLISWLIYCVIRDFRYSNSNIILGFHWFVTHPYVSNWESIH